MKLLQRKIQIIKINPKKYKKKWDELQKYCANRDTWPLAIMNADKLLDQALKKKKFKGKSTGERLVSAQNHLTNNDGIWNAHNFSKKLASDTVSKLKETEVKKSLIEFRQALRDLGALK